MARPTNPRYESQTILCALQVLKWVTMEGDDVPIGPTELATRLDIPKNRAFRILETLQSAGWIEISDIQGRYVEGPMLIHACDGAISRRRARLASLCKNILDAMGEPR